MQNEYPLIYVRTSDKKIVHARRITSEDYSLRDPMTGITERISRHALRKSYEFQKKLSMENVREKCQPMVSKSA